MCGDRPKKISGIFLPMTADHCRVIVYCLPVVYKLCCTLPERGWWGHRGRAFCEGPLKKVSEDLF